MTDKPEACPECGVVPDDAYAPCPCCEAAADREFWEHTEKQSTMTDYTQEQAERIGREAVALGMPTHVGLMVIDGCGFSWRWKDWQGEDWSACVPDPRDPLTAKAFELWTEEVALELSWAAVDAIERGWYEDGAIRTYWVDIYTTAAHPGFGRHEGPTQVEAELAAVKAMREGEKQ